MSVKRRQPREKPASITRAKVYYFWCAECGKRKPRSEESFFKPGICQACYNPEYEA